MYVRTMLIGCALLLAAPVAAQADEALKYSPAYDRCLAEPSGQSTYGMLQCGDAEIAVQDARLNKAYKADMADMADGSPGKAALLKAQRAWIAFRDADCASVREVRGGTIAAIFMQNCYLEHTARRANALEDLLRP